MGDIDAAIEAIESLSLGEKFSYAEVARRFNVNRTTLSRRHRRVTGSTEEWYEKNRLLNNRQETELIQYINKLCRRGLPPSREMIRNFASEIVKQPVGKNWTDRFVARHSNKLISHWTTGIDSKRQKADNAFSYSLYFELLRKKIEQYDIQPEQIYNMDEKGFLIGVVSRMKRIFSRQLYEDSKFKAILQDGNREWITTIACICADGSSLKPSLIYQASTNKLQDSWLQDFDPSEHEAFFAVSPTGWTNNELGLQWLIQVFDRETKAKARRQYRLLILDGHNSHISIDFINFCDDNKILLAIYPPHSTHRLQPLNVGMFKPLSLAYTKELTNFMTASWGLSAITKRDFFRLFWKAWDTAFIKKTILSAFSCTGLSPFNPSTVLKRFSVQSSQRDDRDSNSDSSSSAISASDWRKIQALLKQSVRDIYNEDSKQLSQSLHQMSVRNTLLEHENKNLKEALVHEKKRRQRSKPLLLEAPQSSDGGAVFWSPTKVKEARERQLQNDAKSEELRLQKSQQAIIRQQKKEEKARQLEERRQARAIAKEERQQEQLKKAAAREEEKTARAAQKQLQEDIKLSKKGNRQSLKAAAQSIELIDVNNTSDEEAASIVATSSRGRKINLPKRFR